MDLKWVVIKTQKTPACPRGHISSADVFGPFNSQDAAEAWIETVFPLQKRLDNDLIVTVNEIHEAYNG